MVSLRWDAIPSAVEILPSMPANPRLAKVSTPVRADAKPSRSLIGLDDEIKSEVPVGIAAPISRAIRASDHCEISPTILAARCEYFCHFSTYSESAGCTSTLGSCRNFWLAMRSESTVAIRGSITISLRALLMNALMERERVVRPITTTVSGTKSSAMARDVRKMLACEIAFSKVSGSSAITGQPSASAKSLTASTDSPPRSCPMTKTPRVDLV